MNEILCQRFKFARLRKAITENIQQYILIIFVYSRYTHICQKHSKSDLFKLQKGLLTPHSFNLLVFFKHELFDLLKSLSLWVSTAVVT